MNDILTDELFDIVAEHFAGILIGGEDRTIRGGDNDARRSLVQQRSIVRLALPQCRLRGSAACNVERKTNISDQAPVGIEIERNTGVSPERRAIAPVNENLARPTLTALKLGKYR